MEPVGIKEIAERLKVQRKTVDMWLQRGRLPEPRWTVGGRPAWEWEDIELWAMSTNRLGDTRNGVTLTEAENMAREWPPSALG